MGIATAVIGIGISAGLPSCHVTVSFQHCLQGGPIPATLLTARYAWCAGVIVKQEGREQFGRRDLKFVRVSWVAQVQQGASIAWPEMLSMLVDRIPALFPIVASELAIDTPANDTVPR